MKSLFETRGVSISKEFDKLRVGDILYLKSKEEDMEAWFIVKPRQPI